MSLTSSQRSHIVEAHEALKNRGIVYLSGRQNGKTRIHSRAMEVKCERSGTAIRIRARHEEDKDLDFVSGVFFQRSDKISPYTYMRQILLNYDIRPAHTIWEINKQFRDLLEERNRNGQMIVIAIDNAELLPEKAYTILKALNEMRSHGKDIGPAIMVAGEFGKMRMPMPFLKRCEEIQVGVIAAERELAELLQILFPGEASSFDLAAIKRIKAVSETTLDFRFNAEKVVRKKRLLRQDTVNEELVSVALAA